MRWIFLVLILSSLSGYSQNADSLYNEGIKLHDRGEYQKAIEKYQQALVLIPNSANLYYEIAFSYQLLKDYQNALSYADKAIEYSKGDTRRLAAIVKGSALDDMGKPDESVDFYSSILKDYPQDYLLLYNYGISCVHAGKREEAKDALISAIKSNPSHPGSNLQLAYWKKDEGEKVRAMLGIYFFLLVENKSVRAKEAFINLNNWINGEQKNEGNSKAITINWSPQTKKDDQMGAAELFVSLLGVTSDEIDKIKTSQGDSLAQSPKQKFIGRTEKFFSMMGELSEQRKPSRKKKNKKNADIMNDLWWDFYVPFFNDLNKSGHTEAFCYHIMLASKNPQIEAWIRDHKDKMELFYLWIENK